jgi:ketosteroid isomerase-like protein
MLMASWRRDRPSQLNRSPRRCQRAVALAAGPRLCKHRFHYRTDDRRRGAKTVDTSNAQQVFDFSDRFTAALNRGDPAEVREFYHPEATFWHNYDDVHQTVEDNMKVLAWMVRKATRRNYRIVRRELIPGGWLQQHVLEATGTNGKSMTMFACCVITLKEGRVWRIEEYLDPAQAAVLRD